MVDKARCKFRCTTVDPQGGDTQKVVLEAQYDQAMTQEDESFSKYTPSGRMEFHVQNPNLNGFFEPGKAYYIDVSPVE